MFQLEPLERFDQERVRNTDKDAVLQPRIRDEGLRHRTPEAMWSCSDQKTWLKSKTELDTGYRFTVLKTVQKGYGGTAEMC